MKWQGAMRISQIEKITRYLEQHPNFSPELVSEEAVVCGFHLGESFLTVREMNKLASEEARSPNRKQKEAAGKAKSNAEKPAAIGPFLTLILALVQQRSSTENQSSADPITAETPISTAAIAAAMVSRPTQPARGRLLALGPFLSLILTLKKRKVADPGYALRSSTLSASPRHFSLAEGR